MDIPAGDIGYLWVIPTVGKVVGTLVVSNGSATFTANNFTTGAQWGEQGQPHARVRRGDQGAADDRRGAAEPLPRLCRLDATRSERG